MTPETTCTSPFVGGLSLDNVCSANSASLFLLNTLLTYSSVINGPCERVKPIKKPDLTYDFIVVGGKIINVKIVSPSFTLYFFLSNCDEYAIVMCF